MSLGTILLIVIILMLIGLIAGDGVIGPAVESD
jgi:hypothetical protein